MSGSVNRVVLLGNLACEPELRALPNGTSVCHLRIAVTERLKDGASGQWTKRPNYFEVIVFGPQAERCARYLAKGRQIAIDGRLRQREWETKEGQKRSVVEVVADTVQFIGPRDGLSSRPAAQDSSPNCNERGLPDEDFDNDIPF